MFTEQPIYGIASGFNASESDRINIEGYDPGMPGGSAFQAIRAYGTHTPGSVIIRGDQSVSFAGFASVQWIHSWLDHANERWAMNAFCNGGYSGNVTVWTTTDTPNVLEKWNAVLRLPPLATTQLLQPGFRDLAWTFILQEQLNDMLLFTATAGVTLASSIVETSIVGTGVGSMTLPAAELTVGKTLHIRLMGIVSTSGTPNLTLKVKMGSVVIASTGIVATGSGLANAQLIVDVYITCRTTGISGTVFAQGLANVAAVLEPMVNTAVGTVNTTIAELIDVTAEWGTSSSSNTLTSTNVTLEKLN